MSRIVAIVGRPNVGKSTLFNRLLGERQSIVHDEPGVTRDRVYALAEWTGKIFTLIDTGGFVPDSDDLFETAIREQAQIAIDEADVVVFVVDAKEGITPLDEEIASILRKANKHLYLVVNKVDGESKEYNAAQFYALGLGEPVSISALGGRNIGDFLDVITQTFPKETEEEPDAMLRLAIVGKPNVGKSSLANALLGKERSIVTNVPGTTRDSVDSILKYQKEEILLIDTAGLRRKSKIEESVEFYSTLRALKSIDQCNVAVLVIDMHSGMDKQDLRILDQIVGRKKGVVLAANKWDLIEKDDKTALEYEKNLRLQLRIHDYIPIIFISAKEKLRVFKMLDMAKRVQQEMNIRVSTNKLNKVMIDIIKISPPSSVSGKEIKINYVTQVKVNPPGIAFFCNEPKLIQENYKRFLERKLRENFGFEGVPVMIFFRKKN